MKKKILFIYNAVVVFIAFALTAYFAVSKEIVVFILPSLLFLALYIFWIHQIVLLYKETKNNNTSNYSHEDIFHDEDI